MSLFQTSEIRLLDDADLDDMANIHHQCFDHYWQTNDLKGLMINPVNLTFGIEVNTQLIGFMIVSVISPQADILTFCVAPDFQKHGYGSKLLNFLKKYCHNYNIDIIILDVNINNVKACDFYQKHKFKLLNIRKKYYKSNVGKYEDAKILQFKL